MPSEQMPAYARPLAAWILSLVDRAHVIKVLGGHNRIPPAVYAHNILSSSHSDADLDSAPATGAILYRTAGGEWAVLLVGAEGDRLTVRSSVPVWEAPTLVPAEAGIISGALSNPPTSAELTSAIGSDPSDVSGRVYLVEDSSATHRRYLVVSDGTRWRYTTMQYPTEAAEPSSWTVSTDGGWCWFADPRAVYYNGYTYLGYLDGSAGDVIVAKHDNAARTITTFTLHAALEIDDHDNPAFLIRDADKKILAFYSKHNGTTMYLRITTNAEDISGWQAEQSLDAELGAQGYTYPMPVQLLNEANDPIYLFFRSYEGAAAKQYLGYSTSTDGGATWATRTLVHHWPYSKIVSDGTDRIDVAFSDHPDAAYDQSGDTTRILHCYYTGGTWYHDNGDAFSAVPCPSAELAAKSVIYDDPNNYPVWVWDIAYQTGTTNPVIAFVRFPTSSDHRYMYAYWTGAAWDTHQVCAGGPHIYSDVSQKFYSGGLVLDHADPQIVYCSKQIAGQWEIYKYVTADGGASFSETAITTASAAKNIRPVVVRDHDANLKVLWLYGRYTTYTNYDLATIGSNV